jgi:hypothetical protein
VNLYMYGQYKVVIEGVRGMGYQGDIAIDDVVITNGPSECRYLMIQLFCHTCDTKTAYI